MVGFLQFAERYFVKDGKQTSEVHCTRSALRPLKKLYGRLAARDVGPLRLKAVREEMIKMNWARGVITNQIARIKRMFKWAAENELLPPGVHDGLTKVAGLRKGRSAARETRPVEPVSEEYVPVGKAYETTQLRSELRQPRDKLKNQFGFNRLLGAFPKMKTLCVIICDSLAVESQQTFFVVKASPDSRARDAKGCKSSETWPWNLGD